MEEKRLNRILSTIPTIITLLCILAAFATNDWDIGSTLFSEGPQGTIESLIPVDLSGDGPETEFLKIEEPRLSEDGSKLFLGATVDSPFDMAMTIKELSINYNMGDEVVIISLPEEVKVPADAPATLTLEGSLPDIETVDLDSGTSPSGGIKMVLDIEGMILEVDL
ncbi:MAG: hypothetical protein SVM80_02585 [Halobacteriota archaeon]|nr:hypothetical protein [Halobacteriota archaeon]